jgi:hypothetical protein
MSQPPPPPLDPDTPPEILETEPIPPPAPRTRSRWPGRFTPPSDLRGRRHLAWIVAITADALQWALLPLVVEGALSPINNVIDVVVGAIMVWLIGWHLAFLPSFALKLVPVVDLVPTWTAAVWLATRKPRLDAPPGAPPGSPPGPPPPGA